MYFSSVRALLIEPLLFLISLTPLAGLLRKPDHFPPHPGAPFEGYYTRIVTTSGATILLIFSSVFAAASKPHLVHFSYLPAGSTGPSPAPSAKRSKRGFTVARFPVIKDWLDMCSPSGVQEFTRIAGGDGVVRGLYEIKEDTLRYVLEIEDADTGEGVEEAKRRGKGKGNLEVAVGVRGRRPWVDGDALSTPEGVLSWLVQLLPLHWYVASTASEAEVRIRLGGEVVEESTGIAHVEKNWGVEFPRGWTWIQGFHPNPSPSSSPAPAQTTTFSLAGGKILSQKAYLLQYRSPTLTLSFAPPLTLLPFSLATPFVSETVDSRAGTFRLEVRGLRNKVVVQATAHPDHAGWVGLSCPLADGHANTFAYETFEGTVSVRCFERDWWRGGCWTLREETVFVNAAVEFGGDYSFKCRHSEVAQSPDRTTEASVDGRLA